MIKVDLSSNLAHQFALESGLKYQMLPLIQKYPKKWNRKHIFDFNVRHSMLEILQRREESRENIVGILSGNIVDGFILVDTAERGRLRFSVGQEFVTGQLDGKLKKTIQIEADIRTDRLGGVKSIGSIHYISVIDERSQLKFADNLVRLTQLSSLIDGWDDGHGRSVSPDIILATTKIITNRRIINKICRIYPTASGTVHFEFASKQYEFIIEIFSKNRIDFYGLGLENKEEISYLFDGLTEDFWDTLDDYLPSEEV